MPARCPSCNQVYTDETLSFCPNDGTPLIKDAPSSSSYDPQATLIAQTPQPYQPQQQDYYAPQGGQAPPPPQGGQAPPQGWQQPPYGQQQLPPQYGVPSAGSKSKLPLIIALAAIVLIGGGIGLYFMLRDNSSSSRSFNNNSTTTNTHTTSTSSTPSTDTSTSSSTSTEDDKYRLFYAAAKTGDPQLSKDVGKEIGILDASGMPTAYYETFVKGAYAWAARDYKWVQEHTTVEEAKEWLASHR